MVIGSPYLFCPCATTCALRRAVERQAGDRQAALGAVLLLVGREVQHRVDQVAGAAAVADVVGEHPQPDADLRGRQALAPGASSIVAVRSATSVRSSLSKSTTTSAGVRSTGSPNSRMGWTVIGRTVPRWWCRSWVAREGCLVLTVSSLTFRTGPQLRRKSLAWLTNEREARAPTPTHIRRVQLGRRRPHSRRTALSVTTVGILAATLNSSILLISLPAIFRGLGLNPLAPENISYLLWMLMGFLLVTAVLVVTFGRLGDQYGRAKLFNLGFLIFTVGSVGCALVPTAAGPARSRSSSARRAGRRRRDGDGQLDRDHHRRVPARPARFRPRRQPGSGPGRVVPRPDHRRPALGVELARGVLGQRPGRRVGHLDGLPDAAGQAARPQPQGRHRLVGQPRVRRRPDRAAHRHHLRPAALRRAHHGLDVAPKVLVGLIGGVVLLVAFVLHREPRRRADDRHEAVPGPRLRRRPDGQPAGLDVARRPAVHAHHLAAGHLAAAARLHLRRHPAVGRHLHAAADHRLPGRRPGLGRAVGPLRRPRVRHRRAAADRGDLRRADRCCRRTSTTCCSPACSRSTASAWA